MNDEKNTMSASVSVQMSVRNRIHAYADDKPHDNTSVMSALIWGAATAEIAHRAAFEFKRFYDQLPRGMKFILRKDGHLLTIAPVHGGQGDDATPTPLVYQLDANGAVL